MTAPWSGDDPPWDCRRESETLGGRELQLGLGSSSMKLLTSDGGGSRGEDMGVEAMANHGEVGVVESVVDEIVVVDSEESRVGEQRGSGGS